MNFFEVTKDSNALQVSSKKLLSLLLMEFLASSQTLSTGFLSVLRGGRLMNWACSRGFPFPVCARNVLYLCWLASSRTTTIVLFGCFRVSSVKALTTLSVLHRSSCMRSTLPADS